MYKSSQQGGSGISDICVKIRFLHVFGMCIPKSMLLQSYNCNNSIYYKDSQNTISVKELKRCFFKSGSSSPVLRNRESERKS